MFDKQAKAIADMQAELGQVDEQQRDIVQYGLEVALSTAANIIISAVIGIVSGMLLETAVFCAGFILLRRFAGGYHAATQLRCLLVSTLSTVIGLVVARMIQGPYQLLFVVLLWAAGGVAVLLLSPVEDSNKPLEEIEIRVYGRRARLVFLAQSACLAVFQLLAWKTTAAALATAIFMVGIAIVMGYAKNRRLGTH